MCPEELANESARVLLESSRENKEADKDLVETDKLDVVANLLKYQEETRKWRNKNSEEYLGRRFHLKEEKER
jgi:hypothetical protein